jgi:hypothetical protein
MFFELCEQYPCLWDWKTKFMKTEKRFRMVPDFDVKGPKSKIKLNEVNKSRKSGASTDKTYKPTILGFQLQIDF